MVWLLQFLTRSVAMQGLWSSPCTYVWKLDIGQVKNIDQAQALQLPPFKIHDCRGLSEKFLSLAFIASQVNKQMENLYTLCSPGIAIGNTEEVLNAVGTNITL